MEQSIVSISENHLILHRTPLFPLILPFCEILILKNYSLELKASSFSA